MLSYSFNIELSITIVSKDFRSFPSQQSTHKHTPNPYHSSKDISQLSTIRKYVSLYKHQATYHKITKEFSKHQDSKSLRNPQNPRDRTPERDRCPAASRAGRGFPSEKPNRHERTSQATNEPTDGRTDGRDVCATETSVASAGCPRVSLASRVRSRR